MEKETDNLLSTYYQIHTINPLNAKYLSSICYSVRQILFVVNNKHATKFAAGSPLYWTPAVNRLAITSILGSGGLPNFSRNPLLWVPAVKGLKNVLVWKQNREYVKITCYKETKEKLYSKSGKDQSIILHKWTSDMWAIGHLLFYVLSGAMHCSGQTTTIL